MNKRRLFVAFCCFYSLLAHAQKEGNVWHFGLGAAVDFNSGIAQVTTPSSMSTFEGSASIADANGQLLFYTNGGGRDPIITGGQSTGKIWNRNHEVMYDMGFTQGGGFSSAQSSVIIPRPGQPNQYFLFTMEEFEFNVGGSVPDQPLGRGLSYFEIDMTLNGGLGGVSSYKQSILVPSYEGLCAVRHSNGSDYWIIVHNGSSGLAVFPVTAAGVGSPIFYNTPSGTSTIIKATPDGKWLTCSVGNARFLFRFDASNGQISQPYSLSASIINSVEFSPNSKRLFYITLENSLRMRYVDLESADINASEVQVATLLQLGVTNGQMQMAPDGKIYFVQVDFFNNLVYLSTVVCPNTSPFLELNKLSYDISGTSGFLGLPNFDNAIFRRDVDPPLPVDLGGNKTLCNAQSLVLDAGAINDATYAWSNGSATQSLNVTQPGTYTVTVTAPGCGVGVDSIRIDQIQVNIDAGMDQSGCAGTPFSLNGSGDGTLSWSPANLVSNANIANPQFTGTQSATLVLTSTQSGCTVTDAVQVTVLPTPMVNIVTMDTTIQSGASVQITAMGMGMGMVNWSPTTGLSCTDCLDPIATPTETTTYTLTISNANNCSATETVTITVVPPDCRLQLPNVFTPNEDTVNDDFKPIGPSIQSYELRVYNRWGKEVYNGNQAWNGKYDNQDAPSDVYVYRVRAQVCGAAREVSGGVSLVR